MAAFLFHLNYIYIFIAMAMQWYTARLIEVIDETYQTKRFIFEIPDLQSFDFIAGQFVNFDMPIHEESRKRRRSYSIASRPDGTNRLEFVIVKLEGGAGTGYLFNTMKVGETMQMSSAVGKMILAEPIDYDICFICTGTGLAPFRSMINDLYFNNKAHKKIDLIFGTRSMKDVLYWDEMKKRSEEMDDFTFHPVLSREDTEETLRGYVHPVYESMYADRHGDSNVKFFLCGWGDMIKEGRTRLAEMSFDRKQLHFEIYG
ncbi:MAG: ferredoxin-NADP reductase [Limisphaerales bacterium]